MKRFGHCILSFALLLSLLAGCGSSEPTPTPSITPTSVPSDTPTKTPTATPTATTTPTPEPTPLVNNLWNRNETTTGWINGSGATSPDGAFLTGAPIAVESGDVVCFAPAVTSQGWHMVVCDEDGKVLRDRTVATGLVIGESLDDATAILTYTVGDGEAYVRLIADARYADDYIVTVNEELTADSFYEITKANRPPEETYDVDPDGPLYGLHVLFCGDSISYGHWDDSKHRAWAGRIAEQYGIIAENQSVSGWCLSTIRGTYGRIVNQVYASKESSYDMVILEGGVNDAWGTVDGTNKVAPVGVMTDSRSVKDFDVSTFGGALEQLFCVTREKFPDAIIGYISMFAMPRAYGCGKANDMEEYYALAEKICEKWDVEYLDLYHDDYVNNELLTIQESTYLQDPIHPNAAGYRRLAPYIGAWMEEIAY